MLGSMEGAEYVGPRAPKLPPVVRSMEPREFTLAALKSLGADITPQHGLYLVEENGGREWIRFDETEGERRAHALCARFRRILAVSQQDDHFFAKGRVREDGRLLHDFFLAEVKAPSGALLGRRDYYKIRRIIPAQEACPAARAIKVFARQALTPHATAGSLLASNVFEPARG